MILWVFQAVLELVAMVVAYLTNPIVCLLPMSMATYQSAYAIGKLMITA